MLRKALSLFLPLLLTGCFTMTHERVKRPDEGAVVLRVTANAYRNNHAGGVWNTIEFRRIDAKAGAMTPRVLTHPQRQNYVQSHVYGGALKAGRYAIHQMTMPSKAFIEPSQEALGTFEVKPGQVTYLGHLIQLNDAGYNQILLAHPVGPPNRGEADAIVREVFPELSPLLDKAVLGWESSSPIASTPSGKAVEVSSADQVMQQLYNHVRARADGSLSPLELANGDVLFGTLLGTLRRWHPGGDVSLMDLQTTNAVAAIAEMRDGTLLAGGEFRLLKSSADGGRSWSDVPNNLPAGTITDLRQLPDGKVHVTLLHRAQALTYAGTPGDPDWTRLSATALVPYYDDSLPPRTFVHEGLVTTLLPPGRLLAYDTRSGTHQIFPLPGFAREFTQAANGWMYCLCAPRLQVATNFVSKDLGHTWQPLPSDRLLTMPRFRDDRQGAALERPLLGPPHLMETSDGGATWTAREFTRPGVLLGYLRDGKTLLAEYYGDVYATRDSGTTWVPIKGRPQRGARQ